MRKRSRIHVRRDRIAADLKSGLNSPALGVETTGMRKRYGHSITIHGPSKVIYAPSKPLKCGAKAWMETWAPVTVHKD